ncbi:protein-L-isoaspartate O-methyltransferase family protein [Pseudooceanicola aestuarii]|uniref:protein-L-isoaspartate O-methyltransferase family protein n=1 Tax=Pseudooceanicola aestuarii TaxID=2697319 RepID=UPI0013D2A060|nr:protein-L-isoaspartate O-methyltransferase [Pseudooceanicola aestuarii]
MTDFAARRRMMVDTQVRPSDVTKYPIISAMLSVPREAFVPADRQEAAYLGENIELGGNRVLLEPRTLAKMLDALNIQPTDLVLDIGPAHGYSAAVIARMAEAVIAVEEDAQFVSDAQQALTAEDADNVVLQDGALTAGAPEHGPYDVMILQGAVEIVPDALLDQLKEGGRIAALFSEGHLGAVRIGYKIDGAVTWRFAFNAGAPVLPGFEKVRAFAL